VNHVSGALRRCHLHYYIIFQITTQFLTARFATNIH
jgi:hypothetical protein